MMHAPFLTPAEAAQVARVSRKTIYRHVRAGSLPAARVGYGPKARVRIDPDDLARFLIPEESR